MCAMVALDMTLTEHRNRYRAAIRAARQHSPQAFQAWFNREAAQTPQQARVRGFWDFSCHILTPTVMARLAAPETKIALEIGYGGGRLMNAACHYFGQVIGVDIHDEHHAAAAFLRAQGHHNFRLITASGSTLDVASASIDFIYSFIVLQHLPSFGVLVAYIREVQRSLKRGGVAQLYFGKYTRLHPIYQVASFWRGYRAVHNSAANRISLVVRVAKLRKVCHDSGLIVLERGTSSYRVPDGYPSRAGGQSYVTLFKP